jgi:hypothetical protein
LIQPAEDRAPSNLVSSLACWRRRERTAIRRPRRARMRSPRAYEVFVQRGGEPGNPADYWQRAEAELRAALTT